MARYSCTQGIVHSLLISAKIYQKGTVTLTTFWARAEFITANLVAYAGALLPSSEAILPWVVTRPGLKTLVVDMLSVDISGCEL